MANKWDRLIKSARDNPIPHFGFTRTNNEILEVFKMITSSAAMATLHPRGLPP